MDKIKDRIIRCNTVDIEDVVNPILQNGYRVFDLRFSPDSSMCILVLRQDALCGIHEESVAYCEIKNIADDINPLLEDGWTMYDLRTLFNPDSYVAVLRR